MAELQKCAAGNYADKTMNEKKLTGYPSIDKPWLKYYSEEAINAPLPERTIYEYLWENNKAHPKDIALVYFNRKITYEQLFENIDRCAKSLATLGVQMGEIVTVAMPSIPEAVYIIYAINKIGAVANVIHPLAGEREIINYLNEVNSRVFFLFSGTYEIIKSALSSTKVEHAIVASPADSLPFGIKQLYRMKVKEPTLPGGSVFADWKHFINLGEGIAIQSITKECDSIAIISHTGGTTGDPKGVMLTDRSVNSIIWQIGVIIPHARQERMLIVLPPFVNYSLVNGIFEALSFGFSAILIPKYEPEKFDEYVAKYHPNHMNSIPAYLEVFLENKRLATMDLSCLKVIACGGDGLNEKKEREINQFLHDHGAESGIIKGLGCTEMVSAATISYGECNKIGSVGIPLPKCNCKIVEPGTETEVGYNQEGELCFSGVSLMAGYYEKRAATDEIIRVSDDGVRWIHTGDLGYMTEDGSIYVSGRIKRIILTQGPDGIATKMFPDRIEKEILHHPAVSLCCVVGIPDKIRIYCPKAFVVLESGYIASDELEAEILTVCQKILPDYMVPEGLEFRTELPLTERGKVDYRALEQMAVERAERGLRND